MNPNMSLKDALQANLGFVISQAAHVEAQVNEVRYPDIQYPNLIPVDTSANEWAASVVFYSSDVVGRAEWINGKAKDVPTVNGKMDQFTTPIYMAGIGYEYGLEEVNRARMMGVSLDSTYAMAARRSYEEMVDAIALTGASDTRVASKGMQGLFNYTGVPAVAVANDGTGASTLWSTKTPDQILRDCNALISGVHIATNTVAMADTLLLPIERYLTMAAQRLGDTVMTTLEFLRANNVYTATTGQPLDIRGLRGLLTAGASSTARMIAYRRSPEVLKFHLPMPHRFLPVQVDGLTYTVPGIFRVGGLDIRRPLEVRYGDGI